MLSNYQQDHLYTLGTACAQYKANGCILDCSACALNTTVYVDQQHIMDAVMLRASAGVAVSTQMKYEQDRDRGNLIKCAVFALLVVGVAVWWNFRPTGEPKDTPSRIDIPTSGLEVRTLGSDGVTRWTYQYENPPLQHAYENGLTYADLVWAAKQYVTDVNTDGKLDCIDYAVTFYKCYYPDAKIIRNTNKLTGMNHLLNKIGNRYIEPQSDKGSYRPQELWGSKYNPHNNKDETHVWREYR